MQTASHAYASSLPYYYNTAPQHHASQMDYHGAVGYDSRQPRKVSRDRRRPQDRSSYSSSKYESASPGYDTWNINNGEQGRYDLSGSSGGEYNWGCVPNTPRNEQEYTGGAISADSPNYATYGASRNARASTADAPRHDHGYGGYPSSIDSGRASRNSPTSPQYSRKSAFNSPPSGIENSLTEQDVEVLAAQAAVAEFFPGLNIEGGPYTAPLPANEYGLYSGRGGALPSAYNDGIEGIPLDMSSTPRGSGSYCQQPLYSPGAGASPSAFHINNYEYNDHSDDDDELDSDNESSRSHIIMRNTAATPFYDHSESPEAGSVTPRTPENTSYSSPEILNGSSLDGLSVKMPRSQPSPKRSMSHGVTKSNTTSGPRRVRKNFMNSIPQSTFDSITLENYDDNDVLLVFYRQQGVSYKQIKQNLGLDEAESTLRGRYRTLTKHKNERLRRPIWKEEDNQFLIQSVNPDLPQIKWKQVSQNIFNLGGSYQFGSSTCKKQYLHLVAMGRARQLSESAGASKRSRQSTQNGGYDPHTPQHYEHQQPNVHHHYYPNHTITMDSPRHK